MTRETILLVEDDEDDIFMMKHALEKGRIDRPLQVVTNGQMAMDYLVGTGDYADRVRFPLPFIIFLDLKVPYVHGFEVLSWIRSQPHFKQLPVVLLSSSNRPEDVSRAYEHGANSYLVKPHDLHSLVEMAKTIDLYWVRTNTSHASV